MTATVFKYLVAVVLLMAASMLLYHLAMNQIFGFTSEDYSTRGSFGDQFNTLGVVFSGAAFFLLVLSTMFQSRDLRAQTEALKLQQEALQLQIREFSEQKEEMARAARAQELANELTYLQLHSNTFKLDMEMNAARSGCEKLQPSEITAALEAMQDTSEAHQLFIKNHVMKLRANFSSGPDIEDDLGPANEAKMA